LSEHKKLFSDPQEKWITLGIGFSGSLYIPPKVIGKKVHGNNVHGKHVHGKMAHGK